jgi:hypothetical protein
MSREIAEAKEKWDGFTDDEREEKIKKLHDSCIELIGCHPDYKHFTKVRLSMIGVDGAPSERIVRVTWNGKNLDEVTGWGLVTMEYPAYDVPVITRRNLDKIEYHQDGLD